MVISHIKGTVSRTFHNGCGAEVTETFTKRNGEEGKTRWTCWFESAHGLSEGDQVTVSGMHGDQVDEWTDKQGVVRYSVKRSLNGAKTQKGQSGPTSPPEPSSEPWATDTSSNLPTPQAGAQGNWSTNADDTEKPF
jgi:hypothetical protein